jgi:hypothetical protein
VHTAALGNHFPSFPQLVDPNVEFLQAAMRAMSQLHLPTSRWSGLSPKGCDPLFSRSELQMPLGSQCARCWSQGKNRRLMHARRIKNGARAEVVRESLEAAPTSSSENGTSRAANIGLQRVHTLPTVESTRTPHSGWGIETGLFLCFFSLCSSTRGTAL